MADNFSNIGTSGGIGAYIHHHRSRYEQFGTRFNETDYTNRKPKSFAQAHKEATEKIEMHTTLQRASSDKKIADAYTKYYNSLKSDNVITLKSREKNEDIQKPFEEFVYEIVYEVMKDRGIKSVEQIKNVITNAPTMKQMINEYEKQHSKTKELLPMVEHALKIINKSLSDANKGILSEKNLKEIEKIQKRLNNYIKTKRSNTNVRALINEALKIIDNDFYLSSTTTATIAEYVANIKGMTIDGCIEDIIDVVKEGNVGKKTKAVQIDNISDFVDKLTMVQGVIDDERDAHGVHRQRGMNTSFKNGKITRREEAIGGVGVWEINGSGVKYSNETQQTTDFEISYEFLPNSIKAVIEEENLKLDKLSFSMKNYDATVKLVEGTALDTILNSAPVDFINHYYNLISSKRNSIGFIKNPHVKNDNALNDNLILANQTVKCFLVLRGLLGIRNRTETLKDATDFLVTVNRKGEYKVFSTRWILNQIIKNIETLEKLLNIKGLPKTGFKNQWIGESPNWNNASKRVAGVLAAAHAAKLTLHLRTNTISSTFI